MKKIYLLFILTFFYLNANCDVNSEMRFYPSSPSQSDIIFEENGYDYVKKYKLKDKIKSLKKYSTIFGLKKNNKYVKTPEKTKTLELKFDKDLKIISNKAYVGGGNYQNRNIEYKYNKEGVLTDIVKNNDYSTKIEYNDQGLISKMHLFSGTATFLYYNNGLLKSKNLNEQSVIHKYDEHTGLIKGRYPEGYTELNEYDEQNRTIKKTKTNWADKKVLAEFIITYTDFGEISKFISKTSDFEIEYLYVYNSNNKLKELTKTIVTTGEKTKEIIEYLNDKEIHYIKDKENSLNEEIIYTYNKQNQKISELTKTFTKKGIKEELFTYKYDKHNNKIEERKLVNGKLVKLTEIEIEYYN